MSMNVIQFRVEGQTSLVVHNRRLANPLDPIVKEMKTITAKRKKTDEDYAVLFQLEFIGGLYFDPIIPRHDDLPKAGAGAGPVVPNDNLFACIQEAARISRKGVQVERGLQVVGDFAKLEYKGPRDVEKLYNNSAFVDVRAVVVNSNRTMRCRPIFNPPWSLEFCVEYDPEQLNEAEVRSFVTTAGQLTGLCEMRPRYGKFLVKEAVAKAA
jgi:hypothetical protein